MRCGCVAAIAAEKLTLGPDGLLQVGQKAAGVIGEFSKSNPPAIQHCSLDFANISGTQG